MRCTPSVCPTPLSSYNHATAITSTVSIPPPCARFPQTALLKYSTIRISQRFCRNQSTTDTKRCMNSQRCALSEWALSKVGEPSIIVRTSHRLRAGWKSTWTDRCSGSTKSSHRWARPTTPYLQSRKRTIKATFQRIIFQCSATFWLRRVQREKTKVISHISAYYSMFGRCSFFVLFFYFETRLVFFFSSLRTSLSSSLYWMTSSTRAPSAFVFSTHGVRATSARVSLVSPLNRRSPFGYFFAERARQLSLSELLFASTIKKRLRGDTEWLENISAT